MTPSLPFLDADLAALQAASDRARLKTRLDDLPLTEQLTAALRSLRLIFEGESQYGPSPELEDAYMTLRTWFMQNYGPVRQALSSGSSRSPRPQIATWSLDGSSGDRLYRLIGSVHLETAPTGWQSDLDRLIKDAQRARKAARQ